MLGDISALLVINDTRSALATVASSLSAIGLANALAQSIDCVKLVSLDGKINYMNSNGLCAMEIDDFCAIEGARWVDMWPEAVKPVVLDACAEAAVGKSVQFRAFCPTAKGASRWWDVSVSPVTDTSGQIAGFLTVSRDVTVNEQRREALAIAAAEMKHRLGNTYQMITSLLVMTARGNPVHEAFATQMADRLGALGRAQALFADNEAPCDLAELIPALVTPMGNGEGQVSFDTLPAITVPQSQADAIALVVGELAVNSAKHGAFAKGGTVRVNAAAENQILTIVWRERCDRLVEHHSREGGQGLKLMNQIMRARNGSMIIDWENNGIVATLTLPLAA